MPAVMSRPASNKRRWKGLSLRKATKMQASNVKDEPFLQTEQVWDRLQFQSQANKVFGRVKKLTKSVAANFPRLRFRTGPFFHPFQTRRNVQGGQEHKDEEDHSRHKRRLPLRCGLAIRRSFATPRTTSSHLVMGNGRVAAVSKRSGQHSLNRVEVFSATDKEEESNEIILMQTAHHQLEELNVQAVTGLQSLSLIEIEVGGKTDWEVVEKVHALIGNLVESVEAIVIQLRDELVSAKSSVFRNNSANRSTEEMKRNALADYLRQSLNDLRQTVSEHFFQAIMLLADSIHESRQMKARVQASLQSLAFECIHFQDRLISAEQNMVNGIHGWTLLIQTTDQEKKRTDNALKLMEAACSKVVELQHKVLQTCLIHQSENEASLKETANLDLQLQLSWTWLHELQKAIAILCPAEAKASFHCFLNTLLITVEGIEAYLNKPHEKDQSSVEDVFFGDYLSCEKKVLTSLTHLFNVFEEAMRPIDQNPTLEITDFVQIQDFCDIFIRILTVLHFQLTSISVSTEAEHHTLTQSRLARKVIVLALAYLYLQGSLYDIHKDTKAAEDVTTMVEELTRNVKNSEMLLLCHEDALVQNGHSSSSSQAALFDEQTNLQKESPVSSDISSHDKDISDHHEELERTASFQSPFANPQTHPEILESINHFNGTTDEKQAVDRFDCLLVHTENISPLDDASLDLSLGSLPSSGFFNRIGVNEVSEMKYLDEGSSGLVTVGRLGNLRVAIKESKCPDPDKRLKRLNREAMIHQKINSCLSIVRFVGRLVKPNESGEDQMAGIITEWCDLGDLYTAINQAAWMQELDRDGEDISFMEDNVGYQLYKNWKKRLEIVADIASAMIYMHNCYLVHRDLTCKNVLLYTVDKSGEFGAKVCDFERARYLSGGKDVPRTNSCANSAPWMGPEVLRNEFYGLKADVYSIGTILWELMYLDNPWTHLKERFGNSEANILCLLRSRRIHLSISEIDAPKDILVFPQLVSLVKSAWEADPSQRPTMTKFLCRLKSIINCMNSI